MYIKNEQLSDYSMVITRCTIDTPMKISSKGFSS